MKELIWLWMMSQRSRVSSQLRKKRKRRARRRILEQ
jgi:hypothetical protein